MLYLTRAEIDKPTNIFHEVDILLRPGNLGNSELTSPLVTCILDFPGFDWIGPGYYRQTWGRLG